MSDKQARKAKRNKQKVNVWETYLMRGLRARKDYDAQAEDVMSYFKAKHDKLFTAVSKHYMNFDNSVVVSVNKASQIRSVLGPHLYQKNPKREVNPTSKDSVWAALSRVLEAYINYTPSETWLGKEKRKTIDDALLRGRGFMRTGFDAEREVVTSWYVPSSRVIIDPDAESMDEANWIAVRRQEPLWDLKRKIPEKWRTKGLKGNIQLTSNIDTEWAGLLEQERKDEDDPVGEGTNELVRYYEIWSKMGNGLSRGLEAPENMRGDGRDYVKLMIAPGHPIPLEEGDWEIPLYLDKDWPLVELDFVETLDELWPVSLMAQALSHQKALDILTTLALWAARVHACERYFVDASIRPDELRPLREGSQTSVIPITLSGGRRLDDMVKRFDMGVMSPELRQERDWHDREMSLVTGVTSVLHSASDTTAQERSATASNLKMQAANTRLGDMLSKVEEMCARVARHEALAVRLPGPLDEEDVERVVKDLDLGFLISLDVGAEVSIRRRGEPGPDEPLTMEDLFPPAATYFETYEQAAAMIAPMLQQLQASAQVDPRVMEVLVWLQQGPVDETTGLPAGISIRPVTVDDVWRDTQGITPKELVRECYYSVAPGTTQKANPERKRQYVESMTQNVLPVAIQTGDYNMINQLLEMSAKAMEIPEEDRIPPLQPPPPPQPAPGMAPEQAPQ